MASVRRGAARYGHGPAVPCRHAGQGKSHPQIGPGHADSVRKPVAFSHRENQRLRPDRAGMAIRQIERPDQKRHVKPAGVQMRQCCAGRALNHLDGNIRVIRAGPRQQIIEKAAGDQTIDAHAKPANIASRSNGGGLHSMVDQIDARFDQFDKCAPCLCQPDAPCMALEQ